MLLHVATLYVISWTALMVLVGWNEDHLACK